MKDTARTLRIGILLAIAAAVIFGAWPAATRAVYADGGNVTFVILVTTWARALSLVAYCVVTSKKIFQNKESTKQAFGGGAVQALSVLALLSALTYLPGPVAMIILFTYTLILLFYMGWRGETHVDAATIVITFSTLVGLSFVLDIWNQKTILNWIGIGLAFFAAFATASRQYLYGRQMKDRNPAVVAAENFIFAALLVTLSLAFVPALHLPSTLAGYGWAGVASVSLALGTFFMFYGISMLGAFRYGLFAKTEPLFTALYSVWFLGEILKPQQYMGIGLVIGSLVLYQILEQKRIKAVP